MTAPPPSDAEPAPPPRRGFARIFFLPLAAGVAALLYYYWGFWEKLPFFQGAQQTAAAPPPPKVTVAKPLIRELIELKDFTGQFEAVAGGQLVPDWYPKLSQSRRPRRASVRPKTCDCRRAG